MFRRLQSNAVIKKALKKAMEPVLGDSIFVERWELSGTEWESAVVEGLGPSVVAESLG